MGTQALAVQGAGTDIMKGGVGFNFDLIKPTFIKLVQPTTKTTGDERPGQFVDELSGNVFNELQVVPLVIRNNRVLYDGDGGFGAPPLCRSNDGFVPSPFAQFPQAKTCAMCPKSKWVKRADGSSIKPPCSEIKQMVFIHKETGLPRKINFARQALTPVKKLIDQLVQDSAMTREKTGRARNIFDYTFTISSVLISNDKGRFYVPKFSGVKAISLTQDAEGNQVSEFGPLYEKFVQNAAILQSQEQEENQTPDANSAQEILDAEIVSSDVAPAI